MQRTSMETAFKEEVL